jgi:manganese/zinc/iron transport system substrate-binding protein
MTCLKARWGFVGVLAVAAGVLASLTSGCETKPVGPGSGGQKLPPKQTIVCTTTMIADLTRTLAGDRFTVIGLMRPGVDPHTYEPTPDDAIKLRKADLVLLNGLHLEAKLEDLALSLAKESGHVVVKLAEDPGIKTRPGTTLGTDPHVWWNAAHFIRFVEKARDAIDKLAPEYRGEVDFRAAQYIGELNRLHAETKRQFESIPADRRVLITSHDAFFYFGEAYGVTVDAVLGVSTDAQPKGAEVGRLADLAKARGVRTIFHETSVSAAQNQLVDAVQRLAQEKHGLTLTVGGPLYSDSLGAPGEANGTYIGAFRANVKMVYDGLK